MALCSACQAWHASARVALGVVAPSVLVGLVCRCLRPPRAQHQPQQQRHRWQARADSLWGPRTVVLSISAASHSPFRCALAPERFVRFAFDLRVATYVTRRCGWFYLVGFAMRSDVPVIWLCLAGLFCRLAMPHASPPFRAVGAGRCLALLCCAAPRRSSARAPGRRTMFGVATAWLPSAAPCHSVVPSAARAARGRALLGEFAMRCTAPAFVSPSVMRAAERRAWLSVVGPRN